MSVLDRILKLERMAGITTRPETLPQNAAAILSGMRNDLDKLAQIEDRNQPLSVWKVLRKLRKRIRALEDRLQPIEDGEQRTENTTTPTCETTASEPIIHSHISDCLPEDHPLAHGQVYCKACPGTLLHAANNECMQTWVEWDDDAFCGGCFGHLLIHSAGVLQKKG